MNRQGSMALLPVIVMHVAISLLSLGIAFTLPTLARYILFVWWPRVEADSQLLLATEIAFASVLVVLFNLVKTTIASRQFAASAKSASLVHVKAAEIANRTARRCEREIVDMLPASRDVCMLGVTGFDIFVDKDSPLQAALDSAYEIRVLLLNPSGSGAGVFSISLQMQQGTAPALHEETEASIACLDALHKAGKKVTLRLYENAPFWKLAFIGDHAWVQYCHPGWDVGRTPRYVFALHPRDPKRGLFVPFYVHFLEQWSQPYHPEYDFDRRQLVYRDARGAEISRRPFGGKDFSPSSEDVALAAA